MFPTRREGFAGQHLLVVPLPVRAQAGRNPILKNLLVTDAGYYPRAEGHRVERPQGAATHVLILCVHGSGWAKSQGRAFQVGTGDIIWLPANRPHAYGASQDDPWKILWAHFCGSEVSAWQKELGWAAKEPLGQFHIGLRPPGTLGLEKVYAQLEAGYSIQHLLAAGTALRGVFCAMLELMTSSGAVKSAEERTAAVREDMVADSSRPRTLEELATAAGLSVPHFSTLFRRQTGYAPIDFLIRERIRKACRILDGPHETVACAAAETGFNDAYYFSRCFRKIMGVSPRDYRRRVKG
ncbi:MAG: AraC family transcriptional regulator [Opitutaceae bacterium]|jgi:AraC-like DNA-binding protein|nr:AraC family transcriptional regulator [Opitutaceae bacterium]